jgi:hypothetical protein
MADRNAYRMLARRVKELRRHDFLDLLVPVVGAADAVCTLDQLIARAEAHGDTASARRLKAESLRQRAALDHAVFRVIEAISDEPDGTDLISALMGGDDDRLLADVLLDG